MPKKLSKRQQEQVDFKRKKHVLPFPTCSGCGSRISIGEFRGDLDWEEYQLSGMCQICQDKTWG